MYEKCYEEKIRAQEIALGLPADGSGNHGVSRPRHQVGEGKVAFHIRIDYDNDECELIPAQEGEEPK